jgi:hypothetical protein
MGLAVRNQQTCEPGLYGEEPERYPRSMKKYSGLDEGRGWPLAGYRDEGFSLRGTTHRLVRSAVLQPRKCMVRLRIISLDRPDAFVPVDGHALELHFLSARPSPRSGNRWNRR